MTAPRICSAVSVGMALSLLAGCNSAPTAIDDTVTAAPGAAVEIPVLANDTDPDGDPLVLDEAWGAEHGEVRVTANNTLLYVPGPGAEGDDLLHYSVKDNEGKKSEAKVRVLLEDVARPATPVYGVAGEPLAGDAMLDSLLVSLRTEGSPKAVDEPVRLVVEQRGVTIADQLVGVNERWSDGSVEIYEIDIEPDVPLSELGTLTVGIQKLPVEGEPPTAWGVVPEVGAVLTNGREVVLVPGEGPITMGGGEPFQRTWRLPGAVPP